MNIAVSIINIQLVVLSPVHLSEYLPKIFKEKNCSMEMSQNMGKQSC